VITFAIGAFFVLRWLYRIARTIQQIKFGTKVTVERYGKGSWAVVTGCTDGIGKAFALELASRGFNLVLISRNIDKLNGTSKEV
jgi:17beta-estradiol 17-dehydrogenase / very-long-chain 3-oxoacyl-CoA reductase